MGCGEAIERSGVRANEVPIVIGTLCLTLADHARLPVEVVLAMVRKSVETTAAERAKAGKSGPHN